MIKKREVGTCILFSLLTCGIYTFYWLYKLTEDMNTLSGDYSISSVLAILFTPLTCGIYGVYWAYKMGQNVDKARSSRGLPPSNNTNILYLILAIFGLHMVVHILIQTEINSMI